MKLIFYGVLLWLSVFVVSFFIFPVKADNPLFFETLISIILVLFTIIASVTYFSDSEIKLQNAAVTGFVWMAVNILIDLPLFSYGPMEKPFADYMADIGLTYLIIPIITTGISLAVKRAKKTNLQTQWKIQQTAK